MSKQKLVHRDIKLENIFIKYEKNNKKIYKLGDYGLSKIIKEINKEYKDLYNHIGIMPFIAPEILEDKGYNI